MAKKQKINKSELKTAVKKSFAENLELPKEIILNLPLITIIGINEVRIENYKTLLEYSDNVLRLSTTCGTLRLEGTNLVIKEISSEYLSVSGKILKYEYIL